MDNPQVDITKTDAFKAWFGDWEKQPYTSSKVVNQDGTPMVVYHGSMADFDSFDKRRIRKKSDGLRGFYFSPRQDVGKYYAFDAEPKAFYLNVRKPYIDYRPRSSKVFPIDLKDLYANYDGVIAVSGDGQVIEIVVFESNQAKSVNATAFSKSKNVNEALIKEDLEKRWQDQVFESLPDPIVLYHNCTQVQLDEILASGEMDCHQKHSEGHGDMLWFTTDPEAWGRQCKFSLSVPKARFKEYGFYFANLKDVCLDYKNIPIDEFDFKIERAGGYDYERIIENLSDEENEKIWQITYNNLQVDPITGYDTPSVAHWFFEEVYGAADDEPVEEGITQLIDRLIQEEIHKNRRP